MAGVMGVATGDRARGRPVHQGAAPEIHPGPPQKIGKFAQFLNRVQRQPQQHGGEITGRIHIVRHSDSLPSILGFDDFELDLVGRFTDDETLEFQATLAGQSGAVLGIAMKRVADLP